MTETSTLHYAEIGQMITAGPEELYCPICGKGLVKAGEGRTYVTPCKHLAFYYLWGYEAFEYQSDDFKNRVKNIEFEYDEDEYVKFKEYLIKAGYGNNLLVLELTYGGIACGPTSFTIVVGFDYESIVKR